MDFSIIGKIAPRHFFKVIKNIAGRYPNVKAGEVYKKRNTLFALLKIKEDFLPLSFSIKIEISTRTVDWKLNRDYMAKTLSSPATNVVVIGNTATLARIKKDKKQALKSRKKARDLYDLWYISARLDKEFKVPKHDLSLKILKRELNRVLPQNERYIVKSLVFKK